MNKILKYKWRALYFLLAVASFLAYGFLMKSFTVSKRTTLTVWHYLGLGLLAIAVIAVIWAIYLWELKRNNSWKISKTPLWNKKSILAIVIGFIVLLVFKLCVGYLALTITGKTLAPNNQAILNRVMNNSQWLFKIILALIGPILEGLIFCGMFFEIFFMKATKANAVLGIIINGILIWINA